jgi:hypothetical protein
MQHRRERAAPGNKPMPQMNRIALQAIVFPAAIPMYPRAKIMVFCHRLWARSRSELFLTAFIQEFKHVLTDRDFRQP